jgi:putative tricarboxylic transport membrane protein
MNFQPTIKRRYPMKHREHLLIAFVIALSLLLVAPVDSRAQSPLTKSIEFVCHAAPGGGSDIQARFIQSVIEKEKLSAQPVVVVNRAGGGGAIAFAYVAGKKGDPHYWLTATTSFLTTPL